MNLNVLRRCYGLAAALIVLTVVVFLPVQNFQFVSWDDPLYLTQNPHVTAGLTWQGVQWAATAGDAANWHPVTWLSHMLDVELFGMRPGPHHVTNLVFHVVNSLLLFALLFRMTGAVGRSAFVGALFAIHPQHVESVAWVAERKDVLSTLFGFLTLHAYVTYTRRPKVSRFAAVVVLFALALLSKPMLVTLPFTLILLDIWPLRRVPLKDGWLKTLWPSIREKLPLFGLTAIVSFITVVVQTRGGTVTDLKVFPLSVRLSNMPVSYLLYLVRTFWPARLAAFYPFVPPPGWLVVISALCVVAISIAAWRFAERKPYLFAGWFWYLGMLVPVIGLLQAGDQANADRYTYVPLVGIFWILAWGIEDALSAWRGRAVVLNVAATLVVAVLALVSRAQVLVWKDSLSLWSNAVAVTPDNYLAHTNLGFALEAEGKSDEALAQFNEAVRTRPEFAESRNALGVALMKRGRIEEAITQVREAIRIKPAFGAAHNNLGMLFAQQGNPGSAAVQFLEGLQATPNDPVMRTNLGMALAAQGRLAEAVLEYDKAALMKPDDADIHLKRGNARFGLQKLDEALADFREAVRLQPGNVEAQNNLGVALTQAGRYDEAVTHLKEAIRLAPAFAQAHNNLGTALSRKELFDEAIGNFENALRIQPNYPEAQANLELAKAQRGGRSR